MNKILAVITIILCSTGISKAQEIGVRFGEIIGGNQVAIDGILALGEFSRIHAEVSFGDGVGIDAVWNFVYRPLAEETLNWYSGIGVNTFLGNDFLLGIPGELGLEYRFNFPLSLSLDWRPALVIIEDTDFHFDQGGSNIRYVIN